ncbi:MAG TPA: hypothetical protein VFX96_10740 [Pyrinomonadaceae bacterium]|nr:hypothetical protein [Pyrinomonadaceae bacterium]
MSDRLSLTAIIISFAGLVVTTVGVVGDYTRTVPTPPVREERIDASAAQTLLTVASEGVATKGAELAEAARKEAEAQRPAPPPVEVATTKRVSKNSGERGLASEIIYDGWETGRKLKKVRPQGVVVLSSLNDTYRVVPSGRDRYASADPLGRVAGTRYSGSGAPSYSAIDYPARQYPVTFSDVGTERAVKPTPTPRPKPDGYVASFFWHVDNQDFPVQLVVYGFLLYLGWGFLQMLGAMLNALLNHVPVAKA